MRLGTKRRYAMYPDWLSKTHEFGQGLLDPGVQSPSFLRSPAVRRFDVYRNNVTVGLVNALAANFPSVRRLLGPSYFDGFARDHVRRHPPTSRMMFEYGADFPAALATESSLRDYPYLADVARLEIAWLRVYHAEDAHVLSPQQLAAVEPSALGDLVLKPHPAALLLSSRYAAASIMLENRQEGNVAAIDVSMSEHVLVSRPLLDVQVTALPTVTFTFFEALFAGEQLGFASEIAAAADPAFDIGKSLQLVLGTGAFSSLEEFLND